jgi:hypothetical protein
MTACDELSRAEARAQKTEKNLPFVICHLFSVL